MQTLQTNGVDPAELVLAWDFTTASTQALTGWIRPSATRPSRSARRRSP
jgi:hypothetical protein